MVTNKKAQAQIITTVLIILLVLAAIVIVWQVIQGTVKGGTEQIAGQTDCLTISLEIGGLTASVAASGSDPAVPGKVNVKRNIGQGDLQKLRVLVDGTAIVPDADATDLAELGNKDIDVTVLNVGQTVEIAAIVTDDRVCDIADSKIVE